MCKLSYAQFCSGSAVHAAHFHVRVAWSDYVQRLQYKLFCAGLCVHSLLSFSVSLRSPEPLLAACAGMKPSLLLLQSAAADALLPLLTHRSLHDHPHAHALLQLRVSLLPLCVSAELCARRVSSRERVSASSSASAERRPYGVGALFCVRICAVGVAAHVCSFLNWLVGITICLCWPSSCIFNAASLCFSTAWLCSRISAASASLCCSSAPLLASCRCSSAIASSFYSSN